MNPRLVLLVVLLLILVKPIQAQEEERKISVHPDVHWRTFWMNTSYPGENFKEDYALGMSLNLGAQVDFREYWNFQIGYRAFANLASSDLEGLDPISGQGNRYEIGLFDMLNPSDRFFGKLETLSLAYTRKKFAIKLGRQPINSDWVNGQDGRLSPTAMEGIMVRFSPNTAWNLTAYAISRMSIRGSSEWLRVGETVGIFPQGRTEDGKPGAYFGNTQSNWVSIFELDRKLGKKNKLHFSNTLAQNLFSTYWIGMESHFPNAKNTLSLGLQAGFQHGIGNGGNEIPSFRFKNPGDRNMAISGRLGWKNTRWTTHLNFTQVFGKGRWLSPREWGKDPWYTFIPRERNEGFETVTALTGFGAYRFDQVPVQIYTQLGIHWLPEMQDIAANKYNFPSYYQLNLGIKYQPKWVKNLDVHLILVSKEPLSSDPLAPNQIYNKVEMLHFNGILNWRWK